MLHSKTKFAANLFCAVVLCFLSYVISLPVLMILRWLGVIGPKFDWRCDFINDEDFQVPDEVFA